MQRVATVDLIKSDVDKFNAEWAHIGAKAMVTKITEDRIFFKVILPWLTGFGERLSSCVLNHSINNKEYAHFWDYCSYLCMSRYLKKAGHHPTQQKTEIGSSAYCCINSNRPMAVETGGG